MFHYFFLMESNYSINPIFAPIGATGHLVKRKRGGGARGQKLFGFGWFCIFDWAYINSRTLQVKIPLE